MIYTIKTASGREDMVIDMIQLNVKNKGLDIKAMMHPAELKGYIFIEGGLGDIHKAVQGLMHTRGVMEKPIKLEDIQHFIKTEKEIKVDIGDTVEIIGGPFKGERGKINRIDKTKDEVTIELLDATVPIPVTIATEFTKLVKKAKKEEKTEEKKAEEKEEKKVKKFSLDELKGKKEFDVDKAYSESQEGE